jgi:hypothetical protein
MSSCVAPKAVEARIRLQDSEFSQPVTDTMQEAEFILKLMDVGYSVDFVSDMLLSYSEVENGLLKVSPERAAYQVLVVPQTDFMPVETFTNIIKLAEQGAIVLLKKMPDDVPGMMNLEMRRKQLKQLTGSLAFVDAGNGIRAAKTGNGQIIISADVQKALQYKNIHGMELWIEKTR